MARSRISNFAQVAALGLLAGACATAEPAIVSASFLPPDGMRWAWTPKRGETPPAPCRVSVAEVRDTRADPQSMGDIGGRVVRAEDATAWLRSGLNSLGADKRLALSEAPAGEADITVRAELVKAYVESLRINKSANVVVRIRYAQGGADAGEKSFRGDDGGMNWASGDSEAQQVLNRALGEVVFALDQDLIARCTALRSAAPAAPAQ